MNISTFIQEFSIHIFIFGLAILVFFVLLFVAIKLLNINKLKKLSVTGIICSLFISIGSFVVVSQQDWSIPECYDQNGAFKADDTRCKFP